ncbi:DNA integrity scanning protein DisA nucleotide-binding domain protein [Tautonia plasticadhaerens]|uniref:DNA integrity scanning protein DisA n=1 Tax=Tautonia plasticadhaerens TaxID=2527974 RepID=A0A518HD66_9BACT|nr:diadenylate cyclase [Tautonia plasticadhaerens]QDV38802.1 DNA integrity scanning protein DisA [Tautonia plasticadhaerens]
MTPPSTLNKATTSLLEMACSAVDQLSAAGLLLLPDGNLDWESVREVAGQTRVLVAVSERQMEAVSGAGLVPVEVEATDAGIVERITLALIESVANDLLRSGARIVVVYAAFDSELDSISTIRLGERLERLSSRDLRALETSVPFETLKAIVDIAVAVGREGREGKPVGTLIVVGDTREVLSRSRTLGFDPVKGYKRKERNIRDARVREAIKEIAQLDGAIVVSRDGTVEAACQMIDAPTAGLSLPKGMGTRHWTAAAITKVTTAVAVAVSESTGTVRLFQNGELVLRIAPIGRARALKWTEPETEPPPPRAEKGG